MVVHVSTKTREGQGRCIPAQSALLAEAQACLGVLVWANEQGYHQIAVSIDYELVVRSLLNQVTQAISITWTINDICSLGQQFQWCRITKVNRSQVQLAHDLATHVRRGQIPIVKL